VTEVSGTARVLATLLACLRLFAVALILLIAVPIVRGQPSPLTAMLSGERAIGAYIPLSATADDQVSRQELRDQLQALMAHHATLVVRFMRATVSSDPGFVDAANAVLVRNTEDLQAALKPALGDDVAVAFGAQWQHHTGLLFNYAAGVRDEDASALREVRGQLASYVSDQAALLATATDERLSVEMGETALQMQADLLLYQIDAYARGDYEQAYELEREAYAHMYPLAAALAAAATGHAPDAVKTSPTEELRTDLALLLGDHVELAIDTMRSGVGGGKDFPAAAAALDANTGELTSALDTMFGAKRAKRFNRVWADHIDLLVNYTVAVTDNDAAAQTQTAERFDEVSARFGKVLAKTTGGAVEATAAARAMAAHEQLLLDQIEAYADGDYVQAQDIAYTAYQHIHGLADTLAVGFIDALNAGLPRGGADTGGGGTAETS
jgi:hypothetical protein